ncbi:MAG: FG-GAP-like repeat-containing protein [Aureliella sp.]
MQEYSREPMPEEKPSSRLTILAVLATLLIAGAVVLFWPPGEPPVEPPQGGSAGIPTDGADDSETDTADPVRRFTPEQFQVAIKAVSNTEEARFAEARPLWTQLVAAFPDDVDIRTCEAVAVLKWIEVLVSDLDSNSNQSTPEQRAALEEELQQAFQYAEEITERLAKLEKYDFRVPLIRAEILKAKANRLRYPDDTELKTKAAEILSEALEKDASQPLLVAAFDEAMLVLRGLAPELEAKLPGFLLAGFQAEPDNYYLLKRTCESLLAAEDERLKDVLPKTIELTRPMWSSQQRYIDRQPPEEAVTACLEAIEQGDWRKARAVRRWLNLILGMDGFLADSKRVLPDPLGLLDTSFLLRLAPDQRSDRSAAEIAFSPITGEQAADAVVWYDFDHDLQMDIAASRDKRLEFYTIDDDGLRPGPTVEIDKRITGILAADFFEVKTPDAPKLPGSVAELMLRGAVSRTMPDSESDSQSPPASAPGGDDTTIVGTRHSTLRELLLWGPDGIGFVTEVNGQYELLASETGLETLADITAVEIADIESDGDLDLLLVTSGKLQFFQNNGNRTFTNFSQYSSLPPDGTNISHIYSGDFDRDLDQDFLMATDSGLAIFENLLHSQFRFRILDGQHWPSTALRSLTVCDIDNNASWDVITTGSTGTSITTTTTPQPQQWTPVSSIDLPATGDVVSASDLNNDSFVDIVLASEAGLNILYGKANGQFSSPATLSTSTASHLSVGDREYDGTVELLGLVDGKPTVWNATSPPTGEYFNVRVAGINDENGGGRINHYAVGTVLELWNGEKLQSQIVKAPSTHFGLGDSSLENLRIIFTNGLTQNVQDVAPNTLVEEIQLQRGSCPYVYGFDGQRWELITDLLWNAPLGLQVERGVTLKDRRWEHILLPGKLVQPHEGTLELRITEELWEVAYFDQVKLTAIDHPSGTNVFTNEKVGPPSIAEHQIFCVDEKLHPKSATDAHGRNWTERLQSTDRLFVQPFKTSRCQGLVEPHFIELDFGDLPASSSDLRLFLNGWLYPTDTSLNIGISQNPERPGPEPASLWVVSEEGEWVCARPMMGFPGGKPKTIAIDLRDVLQSSDHRIRIAASQQLYWDEAFIAVDSAKKRIQVHEQTLTLNSAALRYRGYSQALPRPQDQPHWFDYHKLTTAPKWPPLAGPYTRFGDVTEQLADDDDQMVVMKGGDEIVLKFSKPSEPLPAGWTRDYVLYSTGWDKDADINTIAGQGSLPLPFMDQLDYPAPTDQLDKAAEVLRKNAKTLTRKGVEPPSFAARLGKAIAE